MTRRCSHCSHNGHNSRTCPNRGVKLFGVRLTDGLIRKSASMGNLSHYAAAGGGGSGGGSGGTTPLHGLAASHDSPGDTPDHPSAAVADGYASEDFVAGSSSSRERKKGVPWTEEEHRMFLLGLQKLGKGDWRGIARNYVISRTPTQVASHAQKYFIRQTNVSRRKRRSSLFDIVADESVDAPLVSHDFFSTNLPEVEAEAEAKAHSNNDSPIPAAMEEEGDSIDSANSYEVVAAPAPPNLNLEGSQYSYPVLYPAYVAPFFPLAFPLWPGYAAEPPKQQDSHEVLKPTAVHSKSPINVDELVGMSNLSLGESLGDNARPPVSLKLVDGSSRQSAFHANNPSTGGTGGSGIGSNHSPIHAV